MTDPGTDGLQLLEFDDPDGGLIAYTVNGKITAEQVQPVFDRIAAAADEDRTIRLYYEMERFHAAEPSVFLEKLKHMRAIFKAVDRFALVGDQRWLDLYAKVVDPITSMEIRHFGTDERDAALAWLRE